MGVSGTPKPATPNNGLRCGDLYYPRQQRDFVADFRSMSGEGNGKVWTPNDQYVDNYIRDSRFFEEVRDFAFELEDICRGESGRRYMEIIGGAIGKEEVQRQCADLERKALCQQAGPPAYSVAEDPALRNFEQSVAMMKRDGVVNREVRRDALLPDDDVEKQFVAKMCILSAMTTAFPDVKLYCEPFGKALLGTLPEERVVADNACAVVDTK